MTATGQLPAFPDCKHPLAYISLVTSKDGTRQMFCLACGRWFIEKPDQVEEYDNQGYSPNEWGHR